MSVAADNFAAWIGREEEHREPIRAAAVEAFAATLDVAAPRDVLPPGWQWLFFNPAPARGLLGPDGLPTRGEFLPPIELPRRMWAGNRLQYLAPLPIGAEASKRSKILNIERKRGKHGALCFVTLEHRISSGGVLCILEHQDIVFREAPPRDAPASAPPRHEGRGEWVETFTPDPVLLFRYSALTFNGHRIHYDLAYAREAEGYPDLVVHGPLTATLLHMFAVKHGGGRRLARFDLRAISPLFVTRPFTLEGRGEGGGLLVWARGPDGELAMSATAAFD